MDIRCIKENEVSVIEPEGRIDTTSAHELEQAVNGELKTGSRRFLIDFSAVDYISSAGLRVLLMLGKKLVGQDERLVLCAMSQSVVEVFDIAGFSTVFDIQPDRAEAMRRLTVAAATVDRVRQAMALLRAKPRAATATHLSDTAIVGYELLTRRSIRPAAEVEAGGGEPAERDAAASQEKPRGKAASWLKRFGRT